MRNKAIPSLVALSAVLMFWGCQSGPKAQPTTSGADSVQHMSVTTQKAGSELWAENCNRCHNARPPQYYSDAQWDIIVHHMRMRADLTGQEARAIAEFLKAAN